uniref:Putative sigma-54 dependent transcriptional regulator n=1 Tax=Magnetococcus massalia (strain MO-1) TaxID=451514 RepID=A0A1S7LH31_MAGMO|nr:putative sigma-54 dependent transcriptional regulator [Candidatus Magnetococcus massalia]
MATTEASGTILLVDDEQPHRFMLRKMLQPSGYTIIEAHSVDSAIDQLQQQMCDLVLTDLKLGNQDGLNLIRWIKAFDAAIPVVILTAFPNLETARKAIQYGIHDYLSKPVIREKLLYVATRALVNKRLKDEKNRLQQNLSAIFQSVKDGLFTVDADLNLMDANKAALEICALHGQPGRRLQSELTGFVEQIALLLREQLEQFETVELPRTVFPFGQQNRLLAITASPLQNEQHHHLGAVLVVRDETRLANLERDLNARSHFHGMVGKSERMQRIYNLLEDLSEVETTALITGESGTGKELVAEAIHHHGPRARKPLVKVNCAGLSDALLESELFGHVRGAFTGAIKDKLGRFEMADEGTLFLDEIGDISPRMQTRLLRILQNREFERVGESRTRSVDVRVLAATNQNLAQRVDQGLFRADLYYRLKVVDVLLPPLRDRREDIPILMDHFLDQFNARFDKQLSGYERSVYRLCMTYPWPGNIRQLEHAVEHAFVVCRGELIQTHDLPLELLESPNQPAPLLTSAQSHSAPRDTVEASQAPDERQRIVAALRQCGGNKAKAARILSMGRTTLYRKFKLYGLDG